MKATIRTQTPQIDELVDAYGSRLEEMELADKLALRLALANYIYLVKAVDNDDYTLVQAFHEAIADNNATTLDFEDYTLPLLEGISIDDANALIESITAQLRAA